MDWEKNSVTPEGLLHGRGRLRYEAMNVPRAPSCPVRRAWGISWTVRSSESYHDHDYSYCDVYTSVHSDEVTEEGLERVSSSVTTTEPGRRLKTKEVNVRYKITTEYFPRTTVLSIPTPYTSRWTSVRSTQEGNKVKTPTLLYLQHVKTGEQNRKEIPDHQGCVRRLTWRIRDTKAREVAPTNAEVKGVRKPQSREESWNLWPTRDYWERDPERVVEVWLNRVTNKL